MKLLAIDTSSHICAACVYEADTNEIMAQESRDIGRGHAEVLMTLVENVLAVSKTSYQDLARIGVTIGPGSFTGVRVGMSVARGLGLSLDIPVLGVSTLDALEYMALAKDTSLSQLVTLLDAKRGEAYCKFSNFDTMASQVFTLTYDEAVKLLEEDNHHACGSGVNAISEFIGKPISYVHLNPTAEIGVVAELASKMSNPAVPPEPLYLRSPDAKIQAGFALERA